MFYVHLSLKPIYASSNKREQSQGLGVGITHLCTFKLLLPFLFDTSAVVLPHAYHVVSCLLLSSWPTLPTFSWLTQTSHSWLSSSIISSQNLLWLNPPPLYSTRFSTLICITTPPWRDPFHRTYYTVLLVFSVYQAVCFNKK